MHEALIEHLRQFTNEERFGLLQEVVQQRTRYLTVVLEDIYQAQNASAVLRTCDCYGIQDVHIIENQNTYNVNPKVVRGASKWLDMHKYNANDNNTRQALQSLRNKGYRIVATTPHTNDTLLPDFDIAAGPTAVVFGSEMNGISDIVRQEADHFLRIPMYGFTESFNLSVSAAIVLHDLTTRMRQSKLEWRLSDVARQELLVNWLRNTIKSSDKIIEQYKQAKPNE